MPEVVLRLLWTHACAFCLGVIFAACLVGFFGRRNG